MPLSDPKAGSFFICIVTCFLFACLFAGGICLVLGTLLPESIASSRHLSIAGMALIGIPWFFWCLTFFYRIISRACGFRIGGGVASGGGGGGCGGGGGNVVNTAIGTSASENVAEGSNQGRRVRFGGAVVVTEEESDFKEGIEGKQIGRSSSASSTQSHESEIPLATAMAS